MDNQNIKKIEAEIAQLRSEDYELLDERHGFMVDGLLGGFKAAIHKMHYTFFNQILLGILGGVILAFGYTACIVAVNSTPFGSGFANVLLGLFFPGCLILITYLGGGLFTSHVVSTIPMFKKTIKVSDYLKGIFGVLLGNWVGTLLFIIVFILAGGLEMKIGGKSVVVQAYYLGMHKMYGVGDSLLEGHALTFKVILIAAIAAFASGMLCNFMVSSTLPLTNSSKHPVVALMVIFFPIVFFAMSGYQHSPANSYFMWIIFIVDIMKDNVFASGETTPLLGGGAGALATAEIYNSINGATGFIFFAVNLVPSVLGNWVSGAILLPGILHLINKKYTEPFFKRERILFLEEKLHKANLKAKGKEPSLKKPDKK
ncbi:formate/nitrite transporter [Spiroplasma clarkii]|uniref:Formate transporter n=1 Tax=Spiroplasma clarkii TaxID=2139 RepID=A0A1Y0L312_9MOLU|nr:formate/nitrite transporter family protein [Spiroplasma clarkii]ARU92098.1 formate/nitrite transporter [Spiroplasma clarkii]ATX71435.1 formate transporter [Spiroplasma clarkii]